MRILQNRLLLAIVALVALFPWLPGNSYDQQVYESLQRSRDALISQKAELERARNDVGGQIDRLQAKYDRINLYLKQVDSSLRDVEDALQRAR